MQFSENFSRTLTTLEKYGLSAFFFYTAALKAHYIATEPGLRSLSDVRQSLTIWDLEPEFLISNFLLMAYSLSCAVLFLLNSKPKRGPQSAADVFVPLFATFLSSMMVATNLLPSLFTQSFIPRDFRPAFSTAAVVLTTAGYSYALWGLFHLGRSFSVIVSVRNIVSTGPYRFVRHPLYFGYFWTYLGLALSAGSIALVSLAALQIWLLLVRAKLEEAALLEASAEYRAYAERTGFMWPKLRVRKQPA